MSESGPPDLGSQSLQFDRLHIVVVGQNFAIIKATSNVDQLIGYTEENLDGHPLLTLSGENPIEALESSGIPLQNIKTICCTLCARYSENGSLKVKDQSFMMSLDRFQESLLAKFQPSTIRAPKITSLCFDPLSDLIQEIHTAVSVEQLLQISTRALRDVTRVDRVIISQLKADEGYIQVIAEDKVSDCLSFLDCHYPMSHLSKKAYVRSRKTDVSFLSIIQDPQEDSRSLTTTRANQLDPIHNRHVSPAHLELLTALGVKFSTSIALIIDNKLWGLIACHHHSSQSIDISMRLSCEFLAQMISSNLTKIQRRTQSRQVQDYRSSIDRVLESLDIGKPLSDRIISEGLNLCRVFGGTGIAICFEGQESLYGETPTAEQIQSLQPHVVNNYAGGLFKSHNLSRKYPAAHAYKRIASGVVAVILSQSGIRSDMIMIFRSEQLQTLKWLNQPHSSVIVEGCSEPWSDANIEMAREFKRDLSDINMRDILARQTLSTRALRIKEENTLKAIIAEKEASRQASIARTQRQQQALFIDTMCHEIRNPINGIIGSVNLLRDYVASIQDRIQNLDSEVKELLLFDLNDISRSIEDIDQCANHQRVIADDALSLSKLEQGRIRLQNYPVNLTQVLRQILQPYQSIIINKGLSFEPSLFESEIYVLADQNRLKQIICNLLNNAIKFTSSGFIRFSATSHESDSENLQDFELKIQDSGIGMTEQECNRLFIPYSQGNSSIEGEYGGTGLGLVISQELAKLMNGQITIQSRKGVGSQFTIRLKLKATSSQQYLMLSAPPVRQRKPSREANPINSKILVAEDNPINQKVLVKMLQTEGYNCDVANNGQQALQLYTSHRYRIIFMDTQMPIMDGLEATRLIRQMEIQEKLPPAYIVCISGNARDEHKTEALSTGVNAYLTKPFGREQILDTIGILL
jgi:chemotaxis family two-component system sensor kinase Cph1